MAGWERNGSNVADRSVCDLFHERRAPVPGAPASSFPRLVRACGLPESMPAGNRDSRRPYLESMAAGSVAGAHRRRFSGGGAGLYLLVRRHVLLLLVASRAPFGPFLLGCFPSNSSQRQPDRDPDFLLQAPA